MFILLLFMILALVLTLVGVTNQSNSNAYIGPAMFLALMTITISLHVYQKSAHKRRMVESGVLLSKRLRISVSTFVLLFSPLIVFGAGLLLILASEGQSQEYLLGVLFFVLIVVALYYCVASLLAPYRFDSTTRIFTIPFSYSGNILLQITPFLKKRKIPLSEIELLLIGTRDDVRTYCRSVDDSSCESIRAEIEHIESTEVNSYANSRFAGVASPALSFAVSKTDHVLCVRTKDGAFVRSVNTISEGDLVRLGNSAEKEGVQVVNYIKNRLLA